MVEVDCGYSSSIYQAEDPGSIQDHFFFKMFFESKKFNVFGLTAAKFY